MLFNIPVIFEMFGIYQIEAETIEEAIKKSYEITSPPEKGSYIEDSIRIDDGGLEIHNPPIS